MGDVTELLVVSLDSVTLGLPAVDVIEVTRAVAITAVPGCPPAIEGMINVRGRACPVYDLRARFGIPPRPVGRNEHLVIASAGQRGTVIVRVSRVVELRRIDDGAIAAALPSTDPVVRALVQLADGLLVVCDLAAFLTDLEAAATTSALAGATA